MAASARPKSASYLVDEAYTMNTNDHMDHTFCGIMFDIKCNTTRPIEYIEIQSVWVRGDLGPMRVFGVPNGHRDRDRKGLLNEAVHKDESLWTLLYQNTLPDSMETLQELQLEHPVRLRPGDTYGLYIHSSLPGDRGIVYDNQRKKFTHCDPYLKVLPGLAHVSCRPFGANGPWRQGHAWRANRQFVGRIEYGVKWRLWNPEVHLFFPTGFQRLANYLQCVARCEESTIHHLPCDVLLYIMNMCRWDWGDGFQPIEQEEESGEAILSGVAACNNSGAWEEVDEAVAVVPGQFHAEFGSRTLVLGEGADIRLLRHEEFLRLKSLLMRYDFRAQFLQWGDSGANVLVEGLAKEDIKPGTKLHMGSGGCVLQVSSCSLMPSAHSYLMRLGLAEGLSCRVCTLASCKVLCGGRLTTGQPIHVFQSGAMKTSSKDIIKRYTSAFLQMLKGFVTTKWQSLTNRLAWVFVDADWRIVG